MVITVRQAIESMYKGVCTIYGKQKVVDEVTKRTTTKDVVLCENEPCRLSFETKESAEYNGVTAQLTQTIKLFMRPELVVFPGSKITVTQNGRTTTYKCSGQPAVYTNHQEILLELDDDKA